MIKLCKLLDALDFEKYIEASDSFPVKLRKHGDPFLVVDYPYWQKYSQSQNGNISFAVNSFMDPIVNEMTLNVAELLKEIFPRDMPVDSTRVRLVRTIGNVNRHRDEAGRLSCINIGLRNSSASITRFGVEDKLETFDTNHVDYKVEEGCAYLVNTGILHEVIGPQIPRYLITYGFQNIPFDVISEKFAL